ncbi:MAG: hypothetical protein G8D88_13820 [gamma proteobacterium symbiont of Ctena orbiculata]
MYINNNNCEVTNVKLDTLLRLNELTHRISIIFDEYHDNFDKLTKEETNSAYTLSRNVELFLSRLNTLLEDVNRRPEHACAADDFDLDEIFQKIGSMPDQAERALEEGGQKFFAELNAKLKAEAEAAKSDSQENDNYDHLDFDDLDALDDSSIKFENINGMQENLNEKLSQLHCECGHNFTVGDYDKERTGVPMRCADGEPDYDLFFVRCPDCGSQYKVTTRARVWFTKTRDVKPTGKVDSDQDDLNG